MSVHGESEGLFDKQCFLSGGFRNVYGRAARLFPVASE